jgi:DNA-binding transcriptional regulator YiaG
MLCLCGCKTEFEPTRANQVYANAEHRKRDKNRRWPVRRQSPAGSDATEANASAEKRCTAGVTPLQGDIDRSFDSPQILAPGEISDLCKIDATIRRERLLTAAEVAKILNVSVSTLHGWRGRRYKRPLKFVRISGPRVRYRLRDLKDWLDKLGMEIRSA